MLFDHRPAGSGFLSISLPASGYTSKAMFKILSFVLLSSLASFGQTTVGAAQPPGVTVNVPGTFTKTQMNLYMQSLLNGCDPKVEIGGNANATEAITGCVSVPSGTVNNNSAAIAGFANSYADSGGRRHGNAVGGYFQGRALANNSAVWGINPLAYDTAGIAGHHITGAEFDIGVSGTPDTVRGATFIIDTGPNGLGTVPTNAIGVEILGANRAKWNRGLQLDRGSFSTGIGILLDGATYNSTNSNAIAFHGYDRAGNRYQSEILGDSAGNLLLQPASGNAVSVKAGGHISVSGNLYTSGYGTLLLYSSTDPTISSGFGTGASVLASNGTGAFAINVGTGGTASRGVIGLPAATTGWVCNAFDITSPTTGGGYYVKQTGGTNTSAMLTGYDTTGREMAWTASDILRVSCFAF